MDAALVVRLLITRRNTAYPRVRSKRVNPPLSLGANQLCETAQPHLETEREAHVWIVVDQDVGELAQHLLRETPMAVAAADIGFELRLTKSA